MISPSGTGPGRGVVAAGHQLTASTAADVLAGGGNAFDAAIAAMAMACICEPVLASVGGGGFAMTRQASGELSLIDFFPHTPRQQRQAGDGGTNVVTVNFGTATQAFRIGPGTVAAPGFLAGVNALHQAGATRSLPELWAPAIAAARTGVNVTPFQHFLATVVGPILTSTDGGRALFAPNGEILPAGSRLTNTGLADALDILAAADGSGDPADNDVMSAIVDAQRTEGNLTAEDVQHYEAVVRRPLTIKVGESLVHLNPFPSAGGILVEHSLSQLDVAHPVAIAEAFRQTARDRAAATDELGRLDPSRLRARGTTHVSVIDSTGTACAVTISNGSGNGDVVDGFGFMLNNILGEDDLNPAGLGTWPADSRLSSMMCPTVIEQPDGGVIALGTGGSNRIRTAVAQVVAQLCLNDAELAAAVDAPRLHVEGEHLDFEDLIDSTARDQLKRSFPDHTAWPERDLFYGGVHAVVRHGDGRLEGWGDSRRDGACVPAGDQPTPP